ncbi:hypothetical protein AA106556_1887 [Neokomagataea tanensis NBRC 106556]|uniref:Transposase n=1 Tax=Neokomagataea tanensis NBRC 106556 TaxID=1223519 RepID=A0ABQ0QLA5_9PROT|nr:hypothetical protein AA106556_1887 [Neokomagataea tanensis NBRC 106556]
MQDIKNLVKILNEYDKLLTRELKISIIEIIYLLDDNNLCN